MGAAADGNVDLDHDGKNETYVETAPRSAAVAIDALVVREKPTSSGRSLGILAKARVVRVMGHVRHGAWSMIDFNGAAGFIATKHLES